MKSVFALTAMFAVTVTAIAQSVAPNPPAALGQPARNQPAQQTPVAPNPTAALAQPGESAPAKQLGTPTKGPQPPPPHPFDSRDLVMMDRVSDPQLSPDGKTVAYQLRETDFTENKGVNSIWLLDLGAKDATPRQFAKLATSPRWSPDGQYVYFLGKSGQSQYMHVLRKRADANADARPQLIVANNADVNNFKLSADGKRILVSFDVFVECAEKLCITRDKALEARNSKVPAPHYDRLFIRHWDTWSDGKRSQLYVMDVDPEAASRSVLPMPKLLSRGLDGDVPSKPFGDEGEYAFSPDGRTVYFDVRAAGNSEPWSTNFDIYSVPADGSAAPRNLTAANAAWDSTPMPSSNGKTLYYLAMKRPGFEADRFGIMALDLASGKTRELDPQWDRSAGGLSLSKDGKTLYTTTDDNGDHALFAIDAASGKTTRLSGPGQLEGYSLVGDKIVYTQSNLKAPADLFRMSTGGGKSAQLTHFNAERLSHLRMGDYEFFTFKGAEDATVQGYVVKPVGYQEGKKYPVAFIVHGGPQGAMTNEFHYRWNPQTYAGAGFAVVTINFHGSTGYGQAFTDSISGDWGGKPLVDLQKGWAAALEKYTFLDGDRACALGASYGGYMVYWMAGNWNQPWKCFVDHDGVFDNRMMAYSTEELWFSEWENKGTPWDHPENYEKFNPVNHVKDWRVPMLVVHSANDFRIPIEQGIAAFTALQRRGIPSEFLTFPDENHWVLKPQNSVQWHEAVNAWLAKWTAH